MEMSKKEQQVPTIRFKGFTETWEQRKLENIFGKIRNAFVGTATPYYVENGHFYLESNNIKNGQINRNSEIFINDEFYEKQRDKYLEFLSSGCSNYPLEILKSVDVDMESGEPIEKTLKFTFHYGSTKSILPLHYFFQNRFHLKCFLNLFRLLYRK